MKNLKIQYGDKVIISDFNWTVGKGERWALVGENGSGKTTLFSLIYADHPMAYSEEVYLFGKRRGTGESIWDIKARINYMGPELINYMYPKGISFSAREYIQDTYDIDEGVLQDLIAFFHAETFIDKPVKTLSSGQLQLMQLINCFLDEKELLLLDEPFQFLAPEIKALVQQYIESHLPSWKTLILITHYDEDIVKWTQHVMKI
jgi:molybdate transport system ATP-binding protein